jgi:POLQ-like helicase
MKKKGAEDGINDWFTGGEGVVIADNSIRATEKSIAIADWETHHEENYVYLYFLDPENRNSLEFYVPRVIKIQKLKKLGKHEKMRFFPSVDFRRAKVEYNDIAIYLALKLNHNGGVAIFCGRKDIADVVLRRIAEIEDRGIDISSFEHSTVGGTVEVARGRFPCHISKMMQGTS